MTHRRNNGIVFEIVLRLTRIFKNLNNYMRVYFVSVSISITYLMVIFIGLTEK